ncbi:MAG TPA: SGNH/GDSL hydrolase family protein [Planctomycetota bacterium]|nr:SGNH/GDSL hydrolase family protein [Planctomycetota bacterium]
MPSPHAQPVVDNAHGILDPRGDLRWYPIQHTTLEGRGWPLAEMEKLGDRLPVRAHGVVPEEVWKKSHYSSGLCARFSSNTDRVFVRWTDRNGNPPQDKLAHSRPDLYVMDQSRWRWAGLASNLLQHDRSWITDDFPAERREYLLYFPYLDGIATLELGLMPDAWLAPALARTAKPILFYGTSITCGQSVSRAGRSYSALAGRSLDRPVINLGFPGNGKMELPTVKFIAEIDAAVFVIACCENMDAAQIAERTEPAVQCLRKAHPQTPIVLVESLMYENAWLIRAHAHRVKSSNAALAAAHERLTQSGVGNLHYLDSAKLLPAAIEGTVDGTHPNDIGATALADVFTETLRPILH